MFRHFIESTDNHQTFDFAKSDVSSLQSLHVETEYIGMCKRRQSLKTSEQIIEVLSMDGQRSISINLKANYG